jgi:TrmH family RNA methyltransferase
MAQLLYAGPARCVCRIPNLLWRRMKVISSRSNTLVRALLKLRNSARERRKRGSTLLDGMRLVSAYVERVGAPRTLLLAPEAPSTAEIQALLRRIPSIEPIVLGGGLYADLSSVSTPTGVIAEVPIPQQSAPAADAPWCLLVDDVQDPGNLGSILRSAAAAGVDQVLLSVGCADAWSPRVLRAGMGAHFSIAVYEKADVVAFARNFRGQVVAATSAGERTVYEVDLAGPTALAVGNEGSGLSPALLAEADLRVRVPMPGHAESLNVAAAAAVCLFERVRQLITVRGAKHRHAPRAAPG